MDPDVSGAIDQVGRSLVHPDDLPVIYGLLSQSAGWADWRGRTGLTPTPSEFQAGWESGMAYQRCLVTGDRERIVGIVGCHDHNERNGTAVISLVEFPQVHPVHLAPAALGAIDEIFLLLPLRILYLARGSWRTPLPRHGAFGLFRHQGTMREVVWRQGGLEDRALYALRRDDWLGFRARTQAPVAGIPEREAWWNRIRAANEFRELADHELHDPLLSGETIDPWTGSEIVAAAERDVGASLIGRVSRLTTTADLHRIVVDERAAAAVR